MTLCVQYRRDPNKNYPKWVYIWDEWKPLDLWFKPWQYYRGNMGLSSTFWGGIRSCICITSPLLNKLIHWKYRNMHLHISYTTRDTLEIIEGGKPNQSKGSDHA